MDFNSVARKVEQFITDHKIDRSNCNVEIFGRKKDSLYFQWDKAKQTRILDLPNENAATMALSLLRSGSAEPLHKAGETLPSRTAPHHGADFIAAL